MEKICLNLGCGNELIDGYENIDLYNPRADMFFPIGMTYDNTAFVATGMANMNNTLLTVTCTKSLNAAWTNSGRKLVRGELRYIID